MKNLGHYKCGDYRAKTSKMSAIASAPLTSSDTMHLLPLILCHSPTQEKHCVQQPDPEKHTTIDETTTLELLSINYL